MADDPAPVTHTTRNDIPAMEFGLRDFIEEAETLVWEKQQTLSRQKTSVEFENLALIRIARLTALAAYLRKIDDFQKGKTITASKEFSQRTDRELETIREEISRYVAPDAPGHEKAPEPVESPVAPHADAETVDLDDFGE